MNVEIREDDCDGDEPRIRFVRQGVSFDFEDGYNCGAAAALGLLGMAEAIRLMPGVVDWTCRSCNTFNPAGSLVCDDCGYDWAP